MKKTFLFWAMWQEVRRLVLSLVFISGVLVCPLAIHSREIPVQNATGPLQAEDREHQAKLPGYISNQLIVKYKGTAADVKRALNTLEQGHRVKSVRKLFEPLPKKKEFPRRAKRKPKNFPKPNLDNVYLISFAEDIDIEAKAKELMQDPKVEYAHPNYLLSVCETIPNDTHFSEQWALKNTGQNGGTVSADIKASFAWDIQKGDPNILVAIIDSGVDYTHPDLAKNIWINPGEDHEPLGVIGPEDFDGVDDDGNGKIDDIRGWDFVTFNSSGPFGPWVYPGEDGGPPDNNPMDFEGHGTGCSGPLADSNNAIGVSGVAWNCKIVPIRIMFAIQWDPGGSMDLVGQVTDASEGIYYAANNGIDVVSMSFGFWGESEEEPGPLLLKDAIDYAYSQGCVLVAGAGNSLMRNDYPAALDNVIAVAASDSNDQRSVWYSYGAPERDSGSNYATWVDVAAPGSDIYTTKVGGGYESNFGGTSAATPHAAATAAMILSQNPNLTNEDVMWVIRRSADDILETGRDLLGYGRINVLQAIDYSDKPVLKADINSPEVSAYITRDQNLPVIGYAAGEDFNNYSLSWGTGKEPNAWIVIAESNVPVENNVLGYWDTNSLGRDFYTLKLIVTDSNGETFDYHHTVLLNPDFAPCWPVDIRGCMYNSSVTVADLDADSDMEILCSPYVLQSYREWGCGNKVIFAFHHDASFVSGWPKEYSGYVYEGTPAVADVDNDGGLEVSVAVYSGNYVYLWNADGSSVTGWPKYVSGAGFLGAATFFDLDGNPDNGLEIIAAATNKNDDYGKIYAWHADGTIVPGWPQNCYLTYSTPAVADVDNDGKGEIFIGAYDSKMYAFNDDGTTLGGQWPITVGGQIFSSPAIADIDSDSEYEVVVGCKDHKVYAWEIDGSSVTGWPKTTGGIVWSSPAIADIDGDGGLDVVIGSEDCNIYAWHGNGISVADWPVTTGGAVKSSAAIGDIDGDEQVEVVIGSFDKNIYAFNGDGSIVSGWPIITTGTTFCTAAIADVDNDGKVELAFGSNDFKIYLVDINASYDPDKMPWPMAHRDAQNTGCYPIDRPTVANTQPTSGGVECVVRQIEVTFSEPVINVSTDDLTISVGNVVAVTGADAGPYVFNVVGTLPGLITAQLDGDITDFNGIGLTSYRWTFTQTTVPADIDCDLRVGLLDLAIFASYWLDQDCIGPDWCGGADLDEQGTVDLSDFGHFANHWLEDYNQPGQLNVTMTVDDSFTLYISTDDNVLGTFVGTGNNWQQNYQFTAAVTPGVTNFIHVVAVDGGYVAGFAGVFNIVSGNFRFENSTNQLDTAERNYWSVSRTGFGQNYEVPTLSNYTWPNSFLNGRAIWTNNGYDLNTTRYFSCKIIPGL